MTARVSRRDRAAFGFFCAVAIAIGAMTLGFLVKGPAAKPQPQAQGTPNQNIEARIAQLETHLKTSPRDVNALLSLGDAYLNSRRAMEAFRLFQRTLDIEPGNVHALSDLGSLYQQIGQYDKALDSYRRAFESRPDHTGSLLNMALIYSRHKGENARALELLQQFLNSNPEPQLVATAEQEIARIRQVMQAANSPASPAPAGRD
ncbi:tetratricopeptide repeat protein [Geothermobacter hydrogeniphilus]|uniref:Uncharacterized protein n=1 Tax=Geothermobacter hydrogeniphilus TaxID=1969733 RepID=A0A1X0Y622_9BACT|nr:tetratricopeptide repeat protein [Geothermobacter hydrogeniphilus]ORJ60586.1 hypothetical protein B5V00_07045 [Geothermobacter hydrogeniphilus]